MEHISVMLEKSIEMLEVKPDGIYVDGTLGRGGHSSEILKKLTEGHLYCFDIDQEAIDQSRERLLKISDNFTLIKGNFASMKELLADYQVDQVDGIILDIGVSSPQFDDPSRGFSYRYDQRLDMRMDRSQSFSAWNVVNEYSEADLAGILFRYGEEPFARKIARRIVEKRSEKTIDTTGELVEIIRDSLPAKVKNKPGHPAKQSFQALRIEVNNELENLKKGISDAMELLKPKGRLAVISFHSLEDEIVKDLFKSASQPPAFDKRIPIKASEIPEPEFQLVNRKPIVASEEELENNHRSHSAKLRVIERRG